MNNSDERDYEEERANAHLMEEEHETESLPGIEYVRIYFNPFKPDFCDVCGRLMSTHIYCEGPDAN